MCNIISNTKYALIAINSPYVIPPNTVPLTVIAIGLTEVQSGNLVLAHSITL